MVSHLCIVAGDNIQAKLQSGTCLHVLMRYIKLLLYYQTRPDDTLLAKMHLCVPVIPLMLGLMLLDHALEGPQGLTATKIAVHSGHNDIADLIQAIEFSQSSTTSPVLTPQEIATSTDNEAMAILNKEFENMLVAKVESYISTYYEKTKQILPSKSDQDIITQY